MNNKTKSFACDAPAAERPRYFPRQLITPDDLILEQDYFRNRLRLHNRLLHGWGVVCGALVGPVPAKNGNGGVEPWKVHVCPGCVLGPHGDEIIIACEHEIDLRQKSAIGSAADPCGMSRDPWCSEVWIERQPSGPYYIAIKYLETPVRPVRVQPLGCGCDESRCENSRWHDGYEIGVLTAGEYNAIKNTCENQPKWNELFTKSTIYNNTHHPNCWPCSSQPWVVLARVELEDDGRPKSINNTDPRRMVAALGGFCWKSETNVKVTNIAPPVVSPGDIDEVLTFNGEGFQPGIKVVFGKGISPAGDPYDFSESTQFKIKINVQDDAELGERKILVVNQDCSYAETILTVALSQGGGENSPLDKESQPEENGGKSRTRKGKSRET